MLTAAAESNLGEYLRQYPTGPALGVFQMEPKTHADIWANYLHRRLVLAEAVACGIDPWKREEALEYHLAYAILMARVHYLRVRESLPDASSPYALAVYWKRYYNTTRGKGDINHAITAYRAFCGE